jgi:transposase-like protein
LSDYFKICYPYAFKIKSLRGSLFDAKKIYKAKSKKKALSTFKEWKKRYSDIYPKSVECLSKDIESMLYFFEYPKDVWPKIRTTTPMP